MATTNAAGHPAIAAYAKALRAVRDAEIGGHEDMESAMRFYRQGMHAGMMACMDPATVDVIVNAAIRANASEEGHRCGVPDDCYCNG